MRELDQLQDTEAPGGQDAGYEPPYPRVVEVWMTMPLDELAVQAV